MIDRLKASGCFFFGNRDETLQNLGMSEKPGGPDQDQEHRLHGISLTVLHMSDDCPSFGNLDKRTAQMYKNISSMRASGRPSRRAGELIISSDRIRTRKTREESMTTRLGLAACVATVFTVAGLTAPCLGVPRMTHRPRKASKPKQHLRR